CFVQPITFADVVLCLFSKFLPRFFEFLQLFRLQRPDDVEARSVLEFLKVHLSTPLGRHRFFLVLIQAWSLPCLRVYSFWRRFRACSYLEIMRARLLPVGRVDANCLPGGSVCP